MFLLSHSWRWCWACGMLMLIADVACAVDEAKEAIIILKDGFVLRGEVKQKTNMIYDNGQAIPIKVGFFQIDDGVRRIIFSPDLVKEIPDEKRKVTEPPGLFKADRIYGPQPDRKMQFVRRLDSVDPWNASWLRYMHLQIDKNLGEGKEDLRAYRVEQHLAYLTPYYAQVEGTKVAWTSYYLTRELGPDAVAGLLANHPDLVGAKGSRELPLPAAAAGVIGLMANPVGLGPLQAAALLNNKPSDAAEWHFRVYRFMAQSGWLDRAEAELDQIAKQYPQKLSEVEEARGKLKSLRARQMVDGLEDAQAAGQHQLVRKYLAALADGAAGDKIQERVQPIRLRYEEADDKIKRTRAYLKELADAKPAPPKWLVEAAQAVASELPDELFLKIKDSDPPSRLDAFLTQAREREKGTSTLKPEEVLSLAVSGWLLGNAAAESKVEEAKKLWEGRQFVLAYQKMDDAKDRAKLLADYKKQTNVPVDVLAQLIGMLPPPDAEEKVGAEPMELVAATGEKRGKGVTYWLQAPPEYSHGRPCPLLIVLHQSKQTAKEMLALWSEQAARHGFLLVAPQWEREGLFDEDGGYRFSTDEHAAVLETLRDVKRRFAVDTDRVFLFGYGQGANMAFDVGLAYPDLFAGVLPMSGAPFYYAERCWRNAQYLPFYVVCGDYAGEYHKQNYQEFQKWVPRNFPVLYIQYKGRRAEWFGGELPTMMDWMKRQRRANPLVRLGTDGFGGQFGNEFCTMRSNSKHFYWATTSGIEKKRLVEGKWENVGSPATFYAEIRDNPGPMGEPGYEIKSTVYGITELTFSFAPGQIDFEKPLSVVVNLNLKRKPAKVTPSLDVLLEDYFIRADGKRLVVAKLPIDLK